MAGMADMFKGFLDNIRSSPLHGLAIHGTPPETEWFARNKLAMAAIVA
ncbi:MAG: hypothetical protein Q6373_005435 [Candidatus Sigynarchaeota archaeon]